MANKVQVKSKESAAREFIAAWYNAEHNKVHTFDGRLYFENAEMLLLFLRIIITILDKATEI